MRRFLRCVCVSALVVFVPLAAAPLPPAVGSGPQAEIAPDVTPNFLVITLDDMRADELIHMPNVRRLIFDRGFRFNRAYATFPWCCPARASMISGQLAHNHGSMGLGPRQHGGYDFFRGHRNTIAAWLQGAGWRTGIVGKFLNHHVEFKGAESVEPGWDDWRVVVGGIYRYHDQIYNIDGQLQALPGHNTEVSSQLARQLMQPTRPFFVWHNYLAPHGVITSAGQVAPTPLDQDATSRVVQLPIIGERDTSDKPRFYQTALRRLTADDVRVIRHRMTQRARTLKGVDREIGTTIRTLDQRGLLDRTYIIFTSDNGYAAGEHRLRGGKVMPYEPVVRVPLALRGPGIPVGRTYRLVGLHEIATTLARLAGVTPGRVQDGASLAYLARHPRAWLHRPMLLEVGNVLGSENSGINKAIEAGRRFFVGIRTRNWAYIKYYWGYEELYDMVRDPRQLSSLHDSPRHRKVKRYLAGRLRALKDCDGMACNLAR